MARILFDLWEMLFGSHDNQVNNEQKPTNMLMHNGVVSHYLMNDPSTPHLIKSLKIQNQNTVPRIAVRGFAGGSADIGTKPWRASQVYQTLIYTLQAMQFPVFNVPLKRWAAGNTLEVYPEAGQDLNAYYDRRSLRFFFSKDPKKNKMIYTSESADIVAHELGHAILDAVRPDLWNMQAIEIWSFHEGWSDIVAVLSVMQNHEILEHALKETNGDLMKDNVITKLAEEVGIAIFNLTGGSGGRPSGALRRANNSFVYTQPEKLPSRAPDNKLAKECHSFGRVWLGAYYEIIVKIYNHELNKGQKSLDALINASKIAAKFIGRAAESAPASPRFYNSVARAMLTVDQQWKKGEYGHILRDVFNRRKILSRRNISALSNKKVKFADLNLTGDDKVVEENDQTVVRQQSIKTIKLSEHFGVRAQANNPLYNCEIEIPNDTFMVFDKKGMMIDSMGVSEKIAINSARECIKFLHDEKMVSNKVPKTNDFSHQFSVSGGKLIRNFFI